MAEITYPTAFSSWYRRDGSGLPDEDSAEYRAALHVLASGRLTMGTETEAFETEIAAYHDRKHAVAVNSGSSANLIAVAAMAHYSGGSLFGPEASVVVPAIAWSTTYAPLVQRRARLWLSDVDESWNMTGYHACPAPLNTAVVCSVLGNPILGEGYRPRLVLEDNCESLGARTADGRLTGTFGDLSTGSGFWSHQLSAVELGWVLTDDDELARLCRLLRNHGNAGWGSEKFEKRYDFQLFGYNLRPSEVNCAIAREQLRKLDEMNEQRRVNAIAFRVMCDSARLPVQHQRWTSNHTAPFGLAFECEGREARARLVRALRQEGIDSRLPTGGSFMRHAYGAPWRDQLTPRADRIHTTGMFLGNAPYPIPELIERAVEVMRRVLVPSWSDR